MGFRRDVKVFSMLDARSVYSPPARPRHHYGNTLPLLTVFMIDEGDIDPYVSQNLSRYSSTDQFLGLGFGLEVKSTSEVFLFLGFGLEVKSTSEVFRM